MNEQIRTIIAKHGRLSADISTLGDDDDLFEAGLTSHASVNLMLALEDEFDVEFPDALLRRKTFESVSAMADAVASLVAGD